MTSKYTQPKIAAVEAGKRKRRVTWKISELDQEIGWREWFPTKQIDWSKTLSDEDATLMHDACIAFLEANVLIKVPGRGKIPFVLRPAQKEILWDWIKNHRVITLKARQVGFSTLVAGFTLWMAFGWGDREIYMLSKGERQAVSLLRKSKDAYKYMPDWVKLRGPRLLDRIRTTMTFENNSAIMSLPSESEPVRGESAFLVVLDEWAFLPNPEEAWASIEPAIDIGGKFIGLSSAKGEGTFFHEMWLKAQGSQSEFVGVFHPWNAVTERTQAWYDQKVRDLPAWQRAQEYPNTPEEAFVGSGNPFFNVVNLARFTAEAPVWSGSITREGKSAVFTDGSGPLKVWRWPNDADKLSYVVGADVAQGLEHGDYSCAYVLCVQTNELVAIWHGHIDPDVFGDEVLSALGWHYRHAVVAPEFNNHGMTTTKALQRAGYGRIYRRRTLSSRKDKALEQLGWLTTQTSKPLLADELAMWLREVDNVPDMDTVRELRGFTRDAKGKLGGSPHDDRVIALGIAIQARKYAITEKISGGDRAEKVKGSFAWWEKQLDGGKKKRKKLGALVG